jgi:drug/metabolite transporter (DMT)-like permease
VRDAYFGSVFQSISFLFVAILAFGLTCVVFIGASVVRRPQDLKRLATAPLAFAWLNITTAMAWLGFFFGLRHLEPAVVATLYNGIGSLVVLLIGSLGWGTAKAESSLLERGFFVGIAAALAGLVIVVLTGRSGLFASRIFVETVALAVVLLAGAMITIGHMIARWFNDAGVHSDGVQGTRYLLTFVAALILEAVLGEPGARPSIDVAPLLALAAFALIVTPSFLIQLGISRTSPLAVNAFRALGPVFVFAVQQFDGRLQFSGATLMCIVVFCACAIGASVVRGWTEGKHPVMA